MDVALYEPAMNVLVVNTGSSSLKLRVVAGDDTVVFSRDLPMTRGAFERSEVREALSAIEGELDAVAHGVVHGGGRYRGPVLLDEATEAALSELVFLAPLHQPVSLRGIDALRAELPDLPAVCCFDTAFHATLPAVAATYAVPASWRERFGLRRYGFHGLSHAYASRRTAELIGRDPDGLRLVVCHLGAGASLAAVESGRSVDTTMGFTPLEGLVMATRSGSVDPGAVAWLVEPGGIAPGELSERLEHDSGLLALCGTADMAEVVEREARGDPDAALALGVYCHRLCGAVAQMAASLGGLDAVTFTGGVGEHAFVVRARVAAALSFLGLELDEVANETASPDAELSAPAAAVRTFVVAAREDLEMAAEARLVLSARG